MGLVRGLARAARAAHSCAALSGVCASARDCIMAPISARALSIVPKLDCDPVPVRPEVVHGRARSAAASLVGEAAVLSTSHAASTVWFCARVKLERVLAEASLASGLTTPTGVIVAAAVDGRLTGHFKSIFVGLPRGVARRIERGLRRPAVIGRGGRNAGNSGSEECAPSLGRTGAVLGRDKTASAIASTASVSLLAARGRVSVGGIPGFRIDR